MLTGKAGRVSLKPAGSGSHLSFSIADEADTWTKNLRELELQHQQLVSRPYTANWNERVRQSERLMGQVQQHIDQLTTEKEKKKNPPDPSAATEAFALMGDPPYAMLAVDRLRDQLEQRQVQRDALNGTIKTVESGLEAALAAARRAAEQFRLQSEQLERLRANASQEDISAREADLELSKLNRLAAELTVAQSETVRRTAVVELAETDRQLQSMRAMVEHAQGRQHMTAEALEALEQDIDKRAKAIEVGKRKVAERLRRLNSTQALAVDTEWRAITQTAYESTVNALSQLESSVRGELEIWQLRAGLLTDGSSDPGLKESLQVSLLQLENRSNAAAEGIKVVQVRQQEIEQRVKALADGNRQPPAVASQALTATREQLDAQIRLIKSLDRMKVLLKRGQSDIQTNQAAHRSQLGWWSSIQFTLVSALRDVWEFELFSATETTQLNGQMVTLDYGVTVGKSLGVLVLFLVGVWTTRKLTRWIIGQSVQRLGLELQMAKVIQRWLNTLLLLLVALVVLRVSKVPMTAFAFLGGALAIGIGFGAQNIIKNVISGIIVLVERKIRVGDVVTVGGVTGEVLSVDLRATSVRGFDGIESIVPNSKLLEEQVSNWSSGWPEVRRILRFRVAQGSGLDELRLLLLDVVQAHPQVLRTPAPDVLVEDLGADVCGLAVYYWLELGGARAGIQVDSDLLIRFEEVLRARSIAMAWQRWPDWGPGTSMMDLAR